MPTWISFPPQSSFPPGWFLRKPINRSIYRYTVFSCFVRNQFGWIKSWKLMSRVYCTNIVMCIIPYRILCNLPSAVVVEPAFIIPVDLKAVLSTHHVFAVLHQMMGLKRLIYKYPQSCHIQGISALIFYVLCEIHQFCLFCCTGVSIIW